MTTQATLTIDDTQRGTGTRTDRRKKAAPSPERVNWPATTILVLCAVTVLLPLYVTISMAFKTQGQAVDGNAFSLPAPFSIDGFVQAWTLTNFPVGAAM